ETRPAADLAAGKPQIARKEHKEGLLCLYTDVGIGPDHRAEGPDQRQKKAQPRRAHLPQPKKGERHQSRSQEDGFKRQSGIRTAAEQVAELDERKVEK